MTVLSLIALYLLLVIALPLALSAAVSYRTLPEGDCCPLCRGETLRLASRWLAAGSRFTPGRVLHRRWCLGCGWEGVARLPAPARSQRALLSTVQRRVLPERGTVDLRAIEVDGRSWRVLLQCWGDGGGWHGRLVFMEPTGRMWTDAGRPLHGRSRVEVVGQARSLSDRVISGRLRSTTSR
jgi:hypothetical protein